MAPRDQGLRWWGWGRLDDRPQLPPVEALEGLLQQELGTSGQVVSPPRPLEEIRLPPCRLPQSLRRELEGAVGEAGVSTHDLDRLTHSLGKSYRDLVRLRRGQIAAAPEAVVFPRQAAQVAALLEIAARHDLAVVPFGGGSSVVGGVEPLGAPPRAGVISLDTRDLRALRRLDPLSRTAELEAGLRGPDLEGLLAERGFTLGHFPQSFMYSSLGGWIATRSAGHYSSGYGKIEDMVQAVEMVSPGGTWTTPRVPASAAGPDLLRLALGSEGTLGVITAATVRLRPLPQERLLRAWLFPDWATGVAAVLEMAQDGPRPTGLRLYDARETRVLLTLGGRSRSGLDSLAGRLGRWYLQGRQACLALVAFEGRPEDNAAAYARARALRQRHGALSLGSGPARRWERTRFDLPYLRDHLLDRGVLVETLETATTWDRLPALYAAVILALEEALAAFGTPPLVMGHLSHAYRDGGSLYFTVLAAQARGRELEQWDQAKAAATEALLAAGGTLTHQHAVGLDHARWLCREHGETGLRLLQAARQALDPQGIMNPGKLLPP